MVYFNSIIDETVKKFTSTVNVNKTYTLAEITTSDYWSVEDVGTTLRCVPLFHTEEISSSNPKDTVLDNKCVIAIEDADTLITCKSQPNLTITASDFNLYAYTLDNKRIYCIVTDKYNNLITNTEIEVYNGNTLQTTVKTGTNGICKHTTSGIGSYKFVLDNEESNSLFVGGVLSLSADTSIIETGDTATVTASLTESGVGVSGETLSYTIKHGSTVLDNGSDTTDNNGEIEITYTGTGVGDVTITVDYSGALQETCTIEDCIATKLSENTLSQSTSSTTTYTIGLDSIGDLHDKNYELLLDFKSTGVGGVICVGASSEWSTSPVKANYRLGIGSDDDSARSIYGVTRSTSSSNHHASVSRSETNYKSLKIVKNGTTVTFYVDGTLFATDSNVSWLSEYNTWSVYGILWGNGSITTKDLRVKLV